MTRQAVMPPCISAAWRTGASPSNATAPSTSRAISLPQPYSLMTMRNMRFPIRRFQAL
jgi:hypothetical protein